MAVGTVGARISHCARSVVLAEGICKGAFSAKTVAPSLQPSKAKKVRAKLLAAAMVTGALASATNTGGAVPVVAPSTL